MAQKHPSPSAIIAPGCAPRAHARDAREAAAWTLVGPASLKRGLSEECEGFLWKILPRQRVATRQL